MAPCVAGRLTTQGSQRAEEGECLTQLANRGSKAQGNSATCSPSRPHSVVDLVLDKDLPRLKLVS